MAIVGSGIMAQRLAGGNEALALLCNMASTGAVLFVVITIFIAVSGAHFNPAVSLVMLLRGALPLAEAVPYIVVQLLGGCLGAIAAHLMFGLEPVQLAQNARTGAGLWAGAGIATFGLIVTILGCVRFNVRAIPAAVALYISSAYWFSSSTSFCQSSGHHRAGVQRYLCRHRAAPRASLPCGAALGCGCRRHPVRLAPSARRG